MIDKTKCDCEGPYTCKTHDGSYTFCDNFHCKCHITEHGGPIYDLARNAEALTVEGIVREYERDYAYHSQSGKTNDTMNWLRSQLTAFERQIREEVALEVIEKLKGESIRLQGIEVEAAIKGQATFYNSAITDVLTFLYDMKRKISNNE